MKLKMLAFIAIVTMSGIGSASTTPPHQVSVQLLRTDCELPDRPSQIRCEAFLLGVVDTVNALSSMGKLDTNYFCIPLGINEVRLRKVFVDYAAINSGVNPLESAASLVISAFGEAFPCE